MKKLACVVFEMGDNECLAEAVAKFEGAQGFVVSTNLSPTGLMLKLSSCCGLEPANEKWAEKFHEILAKLGISSHLMGYHTLYCIMENLSQRPNKLERGRLSGCYEYVSKVRSVSYGNVERNIRTIKEKVCERYTEKEFSKILGVPVNYGVKMTNYKFISLLADAIFK